MTQQHMLDDREPEPGAAGFPRATAIDAVEPLGEARQVFRRNADTRVGDAEDPVAAAVAFAAPGDGHGASRGHVANRVAHEVAERAHELVVAAGYGRGIVDVEGDG